MISVVELAVVNVIGGVVDCLAVEVAVVVEVIGVVVDVTVVVDVVVVVVEGRRVCGCSGVWQVSRGGRSSHRRRRQRIHCRLRRHGPGWHSLDLRRVPVQRLNECFRNRRQYELGQPRGRGRVERLHGPNAPLGPVVEVVVVVYSELVGHV